MNKRGFKVNREYKGNTFKNLIGLWKIIPKKRKKYIYFLLLLMISSGIAEALTISILFPLIQSLISPGENLGSFIKYLPNTNNSTILMASIFTFLLLISSIIRITNIYFTGRISALIGAEIGKKIFSNILNFNYLEFNSINSSDLIKSLSINLNQTVVTINLVLNSIVSLVISISIITGIMLIDWKLISILIISIIIFYTSFNLTFKKRLIKNSQIVSDYSGKEIKVLQESLGSIREIILSKSHEEKTNKYFNLNRVVRTKQAEALFISLFPRYIFESLGVLMITILLFLSIRIQSFSSAYSFSLIGIIALAAQKILPIVQGFYGSITAIRSYSAAVEDIIYYANKSIKSREHITDNIPSLKQLKNIEISNVSFSYQFNKLKNIFNDLNVRIDSGDKVGIIGESGSGKSTFLDLITGLIKPDQGKVKINGKDINTERELRFLNAWQKSIAIVPQTIYLLDETIKKNILMDLPENKKNISSLNKLIKILYLDDLIKNLPQGIDTIVGERGNKLSGGQKQRIGIARALIRKESTLIILDEATNAIDEKMERKVLNSIFVFYKNKTIILVTHRKNCFSMLDNIISINSK